MTGPPPWPTLGAGCLVSGWLAFALVGDPVAPALVFGTAMVCVFGSRCRIHKLKIDRSFVREILSDNSDREITQAVIALSHNLGLNVVT